ncbi:/ rpmC / 50S ribosomal protein L29 /:432235 Reverse [Candidatus Hepatoplasma crinochetorum]|uniref:Large ribosomal subunit protein uL29 n=1 Tax=Candidatus Hepatoplasma crinochetorum TaxID=295596 RepID=A0A0G7ZN60_9MOLU|nr:/ rpmC / 50S ribosomal protein L29 /:432235 Reverse [Candidatus Hepatoplasma crinochetorum]
MYKIEELRKKNDLELLKLVSELKGKLMALRFENATGQLNETHLVKQTKKDIAKVFTILNERKHNINIEEKNLDHKKETKTKVSEKNLNKNKGETK